MKTVLIKILVLIAFSAMLAFCATAENEAYTAQVTASKMKVYQESGLKTDLGNLGKGKQFTVIEVKDGIAYIEYNGRYGYAKTSDMKKIAEAIGTATVKESSIKIYTTPSTESEVIGTIKKGKSFVLISQTSEWAQLQNGKLIGYAKLSGLTVTLKPSVTPTAAPTPTPTAAPDSSWAVKSANPAPAKVSVSSMTVRKGPTASYEKLTSLKKDTEIKVHSTKDGIAYIEYSGKYGFCLVTDYTIIKVSYNTATIKVSTLEIYASPTVDSKVIYKAKKGASFALVDYNDTWAKLQNGTAIGYAKISGLTLSEVKPTATPTVTPTPTPTPATIPSTTKVPAFANSASTAYKYATSKSDKAFTLKAGDELTLLGWSGDWALVSASSGKGYISLKAVTRISDVTLSATTSVNASVSASSVKFYKYASSLTEYLGSLKKGTNVTLLGYDDTWAYVSYAGKKGYCTLSSLTIEKQPTLTQNESLEAVINKSSKVYKYAITTSTRLTTLSANAEVTVLAHNSSWALIKSGSNTGYVSADSITFVKDVTMSANQSYTGIVTTGGSVLKYMYTGAASLGSVSKGSTVTVLGQKDSWALIQKGSGKGYFPLSSLNIIYDEFVSPTNSSYTATVISKATMYKMALETSDKLSTLNIGSDVTVSAYTSKWCKVTVGSSTGYVLKACLSNTSYTALKSGSSSGSEVTKMQKKLEDLGYFDGVPAGNYGSITVSAVKRLQTELGMEVDGQASVSLLRVLYSGNCPESPIRSASLARGNTGSNVTRLQTRLTYKGYMNGSLDGDYGAITESAVKLYQKTAGLSQTGTADTATLKSLFSSSAPTNTSSTVTGGTASTGNYSTNADDDPAAGTASEKIETVIEYALAQLGKPYIYGTSGTSSYDCSGLTCYCYKKVGISLGRSAYAQGYNNVGTKIANMSDLKRGDLVCLNTLDDNDLSDHVGIYLGGGKFVHASSAAAKVIISPLNTGYYKKVFSWGRRLL